jgi:hypothetical protein
MTENSVASHGYLAFLEASIMFECPAWISFVNSVIDQDAIEAFRKFMASWFVETSGNQPVEDARFF